LAPNITEVTPMKLAPAMVTDVPPLVFPALGLMFVTAGA